MAKEQLKQKNNLHLFFDISFKVYKKGESVEMDDDQTFSEYGVKDANEKEDKYDTLIVQINWKSPDC